MDGVTAVAVEFTEKKDTKAKAIVDIINFFITHYHLNEKYYSTDHTSKLVSCTDPVTQIIESILCQKGFGGDFILKNTNLYIIKSI